MMQKKKPTSLSKFPNRKAPLKKSFCSICLTKQDMVTITQRALYHKYSSKHFSYLNLINTCLRDSSKEEIETETISNCVSKYYKQAHQKHEFPRVKEIYKMHENIPRLFMPGIKDIIHKCHERKRLLEYFHIAKILGLRVENIKFSTFLLSLSASRKPQKTYEKILGQISKYEFSENVEEELIYEMERIQISKETCLNPEKYVDDSKEEGTEKTNSSPRRVRFYIE